MAFGTALRYVLRQILGSREKSLEPLFWYFSGKATTGYAGGVK